MNPFPTSGYSGARYFCDRKTEFETIREALLNERNITLYSVRRLGKSSLIEYTSEKLRKENVFTIKVDLLPTQNLSEFTEALSNSILAFQRKKSPFKAVANQVFEQLFKSNIVFSTDPLTNLPEVKLQPGHNQQSVSTLKAILSTLNESNVKVVLALDEFQQVTHYPEKGALALVRSLTQEFAHIRFIFLGSEESILTRIFTHPKEPFYNSTQLLQLKRIPPKTYFQFARKHFKPSELPATDFEWIYNWCNGITFHVQWFCNRLYSKNPDSINEGLLRETALEILKDFNFQFNANRRLLTNDQFSLLQGIARENRLYKPTSQRFIQEHNLKLAANVQRSLAALLKKGLIQEDFDENNERFYFISDVFFSRWLQTL